MIPVQMIYAPADTEALGVACKETPGVIPKRDQDGQDWFGAAHQADGFDFFKDQLAAIDSKIRDREEQLTIFYPDGVKLPDGEEDLLRLYRTEQALTEEMMREASTKPIGELYRHRLRTVRQRLSQLSQNGVNDAAGRAKYWQAETELEILNESMKRWLEWVACHTSPSV
jgi:hypothetical protein